jgi:hypothetical protein
MYAITFTDEGGRQKRYRREEFFASVAQMPAIHAQEPLSAAEAAAAAHALKNRVQCLGELLDAQVAHSSVGDTTWAKTWDELHAAQGAYVKLQNLAQAAR